MLRLVSLCLLSCIALASGETAFDHDQVVVCYVATWAVYRPGNGQFNLDNVDPRLCTHLVYSFTGIDEKTFAIKSLDPEFDITKGGFNKAISLKRVNPELKVTVAVGGWVEGSEKYSNMSYTPHNRRAFVSSVVDFLKTYNFDGLDLDWEYPSNRGGRPEDKENFIKLIKELKDAFRPHGWLLTAAVASGKNVADSAYDIPMLGKYLDLIHLMAYDYHGKWDSKTGHNAPLYSREDETEFEQMLNVNFSVRHYINSGIPVEKFVLGLGLYGRTFLLNNTANPGIGVPALKTAFAGPYTREDGFLGYNEICEKQLLEKGWAIAWQRAHQAPYMFKDNMWMSFDDSNSIGIKVAFAQRLGLAGVMVWSIDTDDFRGTCSGTKFPLLRSVNKNLMIHAPERFIEKIKVVSTPRTTTTTTVATSITTSTIPPHTTGVAIPTPEVGIHMPGVIKPSIPSQPEEVHPIGHKPGVPLPTPIVPVAPDRTPYLPGPQDDRDLYDKVLFEPDQTLGEQPIAPYPGVIVYEAPDEIGTDLDQDKPIKTDIDFHLIGGNEIDEEGYYNKPASTTGKMNGSEKFQLGTLTLLSAIVFAFILSH